MLRRPTLAVPRPRAREYIAYYGDVEYADFCHALGLRRIDYWSFVQRTMSDGPYWWSSSLQLQDIRRLPSPDTYKSLLLESHPSECAGPRRYEHYIRMYRGNRDELLDKLDASNDAAWREWAKRI